MNTPVPRLAPATWIAIAALAVALAAPPAAFALGKASVGTFHLKNGAVATKKIQGGAVNTHKLRRGAVTTGKIRNGAVSRRKLAPSARPHLIAAGTVVRGERSTRNHSAGAWNASEEEPGLYLIHMRVPGFCETGNRPIFHVTPRRNRGVNIGGSRSDCSTGLLRTFVALRDFNGDLAEGTFDFTAYSPGRTVAPAPDPS